MSIYSNENISKITKLSPRKFKKHENYGVYSLNGVYGKCVLYGKIKSSSIMG